MKTNDNQLNTVAATKQVSDDKQVMIVKQGGKLKITFLGNSITRHMPKPEIGWVHDWGMAASCLENDYVHVMLRHLEEKYGPVDYCICSLSKWEREYWNLDILKEYQAAVDFDADIVIVRIAENVWGVRNRLEELPLEKYWDYMIKFFTNEKSKIIVTDDFWSWDTIDDPIHKVCEQNNYKLVKLGDIGADPSNKALGEFEHPGVEIHPNDKGMEAIALRILEEGELI
ncbi:MAG: SGNH/GDSL hydrolase family protein [Bacilli bacterium]|nr:SGNH/GDSL hydrolase family protein [Bacilli bacterium]